MIKYSKKDTTNEERKKILDGALAISTLDCKMPVDEDMELFQKYVEGKIDPDEITNRLIEKYKED
ncbi:hypothetical protein [Clostridium butyricum]|uniref:hypothetical protein n=1 Tax=Clostridium butyricum TaxID=1492 RepID=UPI00374E3729